MDFSVALDRIKTGIADGSSEILTAINDRVSAVESELNLWKTRHSRLETQLTELKAETGDKPQEYIQNLKTEVETLKTQIKALETEKTTLQTKVTEFEKQALYNSAAQKAGIDPDAFSALVQSGVIGEEVKIEGDKVLIGGKAIAEYLEEPGKTWIKNALTVQSSPGTNDQQQTTETPPSSQTPQGGMTSGKGESDFFEAVLNTRGYAFPNSNSK